jgi:hypothetical protein
LPNNPKKPSITLGDLNDVTLGSSAVFEKQIPQEEAKNPEAGSESSIETRGFPSPFRNGFGFGTDCK